MYWHFLLPTYLVPKTYKHVLSWIILTFETLTTHISVGCSAQTCNIFFIFFFTCIFSFALLVSGRKAWNVILISLCMYVICMHGVIHLCLFLYVQIVVKEKPTTHKKYRRLDGWCLGGCWRIKEMLKALRCNKDKMRKCMIDILTFFVCGR